MKKYLIILATLMLTSCTNSPDPCTDYVGPNPNVIAEWTEPVEIVDFYILELSTNGHSYSEIARTDDKYYRFNGEIEFCNTYKCRVIAVGLNGKRSIPSIPSARYDPIPKEK